MRLVLDALTHEDCEAARLWRNELHDAGMLRTTRRLTDEEQSDFFYKVVANPSSRHRYLAVRLVDGLGPSFVAMVGLTDISPENGTAEISLIVSPENRRHGIGRSAVSLILREAFDRMRLAAVYGEVYRCNTVGVEFWARICGEYGGSRVTLPCRKFWNGVHYDSTYFTVTAKKFRKVTTTC